MTTLYRPVLIESAGQAEALPEGTVVIEVDARTGTHNWAFTSEAWSPDDLNVFPTEYHIALVPIEAEEETTGALVNRAGEIRWEESIRYATPWENA